MDSNEVEVESGEAPYADHEHCNLSIGIAESSGSSEVDEFFSVDPVAEELDGNQVAELVLYDVNAHLDGGELEFGLGFNTGENEFLEQATGNNPLDFGIDSNTFGGVYYEEPGIIDFQQFGGRDEVDANYVERQINYRERYSGGLFIDSTDELDIHIEVANQTGQNVSGEVHAQLVFAIHDVAQGIPQFANPSRLME
jgi:hypothetical protein